MTPEELEQKKQELAAKQAEIEALQKELDMLAIDETQATQLQQALDAGVQVKQLNIIVNPPTGEKLIAHLTDTQGNTMSFKTDTPTTMHMTAVNAALQHALTDIETRKTAALDKLNLLLA